MSDYWSRAPFISHDGPDSDGVRAEVKVTLGFAIPKTIEASDKGKAAKAIFPVDNTKWPSAGWAPVDSDVMKVVQEAHDNDTPLYFRIETIRKPGVDRSASIVELTKGSDAARENANKSLAAVKREDDDQWTISKRAMTRLEEDPSEEGGTSAYSHSLDELKGANSSRASTSATVAVEPLIAEDGEPNYASNGTLVAANLFAFLADHCANNGLDTDSATLRNLAKLLLSVTSKLQVETSRGVLEEADLTAESHKNAVQIVRLTIESISPLAIDVLEDDKAQVAWAGTVLKRSLALWRWSAGEASKIN